MFSRIIKPSLILRNNSNEQLFKMIQNINKNSDENLQSTLRTEANNKKHQEFISNSISGINIGILITIIPFGIYEFISNF